MVEGRKNQRWRRGEGQREVCFATRVDEIFFFFSKKHLHEDWVNAENKLVKRGEIESE